MNTSADATTKENRHLYSDKKIISHKRQRLDSRGRLPTLYNSSHSTEITSNYLV